MAKQDLPSVEIDTGGVVADDEIHAQVLGDEQLGRADVNAESTLRIFRPPTKIAESSGMRKKPAVLIASAMISSVVMLLARVDHRTLLGPDRVARPIDP